MKMTIEESVGGKITKGAMEAPSVVEGLEVIEKRSGGGAFGVEGEALVEDFRLREAKALSEKALAWIANCTRWAGFKTIFSGDPPVSSVARTAVRVCGLPQVLGAVEGLLLHGGWAVGLFSSKLDRRRGS